MALTTVLIVLARVLVGGLFLIAGIRNTLKLSERIAGKTNYGWPLPAGLVGAGFAIEVFGGASVIFGVWPVLGAVALIVFTVLATVLYHNFTLFSGAERGTHFYFVTVNAALCGALLLVIAVSL